MLPFQIQNLHKSSYTTWRDFDSLLPDDADLAPLTIQNAVRLAARKRDSMPTSVLVLGLRYEPPNANLDFWRMELFTLPEALAGDRYIRTEIHQLLDDAEDAQKALTKACRSFARNLLSRGNREPVGKDINRFVEQIPVNDWYWSTLESRFHEVLQEYNLDCDHEEIRSQWLRFVRDTLQAAWQQHRVSAASGDIWAVRALVRAEGPVLRKLKELKEEIMRLESPEVREEKT